MHRVSSGLRTGKSCDTLVPSRTVSETTVLMSRYRKIPRSRRPVSGTVIYAGNELKGLGNLVLVRHTNNYVTAYAHAKELRVKRGDPIKQGSVIGISGQTEETDMPQFRFEIRKNSARLTH